MISTDDNYARLFADVYKLAVSDDYKRVRGSILDKLVGSGVSPSVAREYISKNSDYIKNKVQENVYKESQSYGHKTRKMQRESIAELVDLMVDAYKEGLHDK